MGLITCQLLACTALVYLGIPGYTATAQDTQPARATFAEMIAFARLSSVACQQIAPDVEAVHAFALQRFIKPQLTDKEIAAKEKDVKPATKSGGAYAMVQTLCGQNGAGAYSGSGSEREKLELRLSGVLFGRPPPRLYRCEHLYID